MAIIKYKSIKRKPKSIHINKIGDSYGDLMKFTNDIIENMGDNFFQSSTFNEFLFQALKHVYPINKNLSNTEKSIESACEKICNHFGIGSDELKRISIFGGFSNIDPKKMSFTQLFLEEIIGFDKLPAHEYSRIHDKVYHDLEDITNLINSYEEKVCIIKYLDKNDIPKLHDDWIVFEFYKRCLRERTKILNFYFNDIKNVAIERARFRYGILSLLNTYSFDNSYFFGNPFSIPYFDYTKIDLCGHRVDSFPWKIGKRLKDLYLKDKSKFYRQYFKIKSREKHFEDLNFYLPQIPMNKDREFIFKELISLFKSKRWLSFYALALPQVEGLFSEMHDILFPDRDYSQQSLPTKVNSIRPHYSNSDSYFDYYQFHLPKLRNKFSHTGHDDEFELKSYDLLTDLLHLLQVFNELENPFIKLSKIMRRSNPDDFLTVENFANFFILLNDLKKQQQLNKLSTELKSFQEDFLKNCHLEFILLEADSLLSKLISNICTIIDSTFNNMSMEELKKINKPKIDKLLQEEGTLDIFDNIFRSEFDERIEICYIFLINYKKYLITIDKSTASLVDENFDKIKNIVQNLIYIKDKLTAIN